MSVEKFVSELSSIRLVNCFNPYSQCCDIYDLPAAQSDRRLLLKNMLEVAVDRDIDAIWIGRDLGYRGGRRTGLALTDEVNADAYARRWGLRARQFTNGLPCKERTASIIWDELNFIKEDIFLWNVFPLHPHESDNVFTNRNHNSLERKIGEEVLLSLIEMLRPRKLIAVGNDAVASISKLAPLVPSYKVRHPSYGGQAQFVAQINEIYNINKVYLQGELL